MRASESRSGRSHSWKAGDRQRFGGRGHLAGQLAAGGEGAVCWFEKNLGPNLSRVLGSSRNPLPSPRQHSLHRVLAATWNCSSFSVCSWVRSRSSGAAILPPPLRFWPVRTVTRRKVTSAATTSGLKGRRRATASARAGPTRGMGRGGNGDNSRRQRAPSSGTTPNTSENSRGTAWAWRPWELVKGRIDPWKKRYDQPRQRIKKQNQRHYFADKRPSSQSYGFSSSRVGIGELWE